MPRLYVPMCFFLSLPGLEDPLEDPLLRRKTHWLEIPEDPLLREVVVFGESVAGHPAALDQNMVHDWFNVESLSPCRCFVSV